MSLPAESRVSDADMPRIALVACTRNRADRLAPFFSSLRTLQCSEPWELVLVDSASTDDTLRRLEAFAQQFGAHCSVVRATQKGLGLARNVGWRATRAPLVAFIDDDCYADPAYLQDVITCFAEQPSLGFLGGRIELFDPTDLPVTIKTSRERADYAPGTVLRAGELHGANMAFRRTALEAVAGFDDALGAGTPFPCEDIDVLARLLLAGWPGAYDPRPWVAHHHGRRTSAELAQLMQSYDAGRGAFQTKMVLRGSGAYLWQWMRRVRYQPVGGTWRELVAAVTYLRHALLRAGRAKAVR